MADKPVTWGQRMDLLRAKRKDAENTLAVLADLEGMANLEQEAGHFRTQIEGYRTQEASAKQAAATAEAQQRAAETSLANAQARAETEIKTYNAQIAEVATAGAQAETEMRTRLETLNSDLVARHTQLVAQHDKEIRGLEATKARLEADIKALRERVGAL